MGIYDSLNKLYRKHFVSHQDKFLERNGHYVTKVLNDIQEESFSIMDFPSGVGYSNSTFNSESDFSLLNEVGLNKIKFIEVLTVLCFVDNYMVDGGIEFVFESFSEIISKNTINKDINIEKLKSIFIKSSRFYKKNMESNISSIPNVNSIYHDAWDVEKPNHLDSIFASFYTIQGYTLFMTNSTSNDNPSYSLNVSKVKEKFMEFGFKDGFDNSKVLPEIYQLILKNEYNKI